MDDLIDDPRPGRNEAEYTVSEISGAVKRTLEDRFGRIRVRGEIGRVFRAKSGHLYYDIKDDRNVLACTTWKGQLSQLSVAPEEGLEVVVTGRLSAFAAQSKYNLNVDQMQVAGQGALMAMLEKRRAQLAAEGLFEAERKRPLPFLPDVIGVITSPQGAVIRDILHRLRDRFPRHVLIWPVAVQGQNCAPEVTNAIRGFNALNPGGPIPKPDLLIVARGGGSIEDLWGFNEEAVVRAAAASDIPLISAVGHETDTTLIDHAADRRAPTPTAAAEMAVPVRLDLLAAVEAMAARQIRAARAAVAMRGQRLADLSRGLPRPDGVLAGPRQRLDLQTERLPAALRGRIGRARIDLSALTGRAGPGALAARLRSERRRLDALASRLEAGLPRAVTQARGRFDTLSGVLSRRAARGFEERRDLAKLTARLRSDVLTRRALADGARLTALKQRLSLTARTAQDRARQRLDALDRLRQSLGYEATLKRGFAVVRSGETVLPSKAAAETAAGLSIQFQDGTLSLSGRAPSRPRKAKSPPPDQGQLF
ncbi:MAG: exodeoxyribonuclease VII large subunit [Pseudomonadota bacterium]